MIGADTLGPASRRDFVRGAGSESLLLRLFQVEYPLRLCKEAAQCAIVVVGQADRGPVVRSVRCGFGVMMARRVVVARVLNVQVGNALVRTRAGVVMVAKELVPARAQRRDAAE